MAELKLLRGQVALIDDEDVPRVTGLRWYKGTKGYVMAWIPGERTVIYLHRLILELQPGEEADHRNHNKLDNRKSELRKVTSHQNRGNTRGLLSRRKASVFKGVTWHRKNEKWQAGLKVQENGRTRFRFLGTFLDEKQAATAYNVAAVAYFGQEYAFLNKV